MLHNPVIVPRTSFIALLQIEAKSGGLSMLTQGDVSFPYLIESSPMLLLCSEDNQLKPLIDFRDCIGIPKPRIASILLSFRPIILSDIENDIKPRIYAWEKTGIEQEYIGKMQLKYVQMLLFFKRKRDFQYYCLVIWASVRKCWSQFLHQVHSCC